MNYKKYNNNEHWDDFDIFRFFYGDPSDPEDNGRHLRTIPDSKYDIVEYFALNRYDAHMILSAFEFDIDKRKMLEMDHLCNILDEYAHISPPDQPILIDVKSRKILDGVKRLFLLKKQRSPRVCWVQFINVDSLEI